jgi:uncharacterized protein (PEP-CTERM system associated)
LQSAPRPYQFSFFGDLSERYTNNAFGSALHPSPDYDTRGEFGLTVEANTRRLNGQLQYLLDVDYFARAGGGAVVSNRLDANGEAELWQDHLLLAARLFANPIYSTGLGNIAPTGEALPPGANGDLINTYGITVQPDFTFRLGDFLRSDFLPSYNAIFLGGSGTGAVGGGKLTSQQSIYALTERVTSGEDFFRLQWAVIASYSKMNRSAGGLSQRFATGELAYALDHDISAVLDAGYQWVSANIALNGKFSGPVLMAGLKFNGARLTGEFRAGEQYHRTSLTGHVEYQVTPTISLVGDATDNVTTPTAALLNPNSSLADVNQSLLGAQAAASSPQNLQNLTTQSIGLQNIIAHISVDTIAARYNLDEINAEIAAFVTTQTSASPVAPGQHSNLQVRGIRPSLSYTFSPALRGTLSGSFASERLLVGSDNVMQGSVEADYTLSENTSLYASGSYLDRQSDKVLAAFSPESGNVSIWSARIGIRHQF